MKNNSEKQSEERRQKKLIIEQEDGVKRNLIKFSISDENKLFRMKKNPYYSRYMKDTLSVMKNPSERLLNFLLPKNYKDSVEQEYVSFAKWAIVSSFFMTLCGVLSMQSLLIAVGIGASTAIPMAAALNWILKDGLGQLGGMLCASFINSKFDAHPRQWRFRAGLILDISFLLETLTPMFPHLFLLFGSIANVGKNIGWISASASRAAIHKSFMKTENLADITAKAGSQSIFASVLGTSVGLGIAPSLNYLCGTQNIYMDSPTTVFSVTSFFCVCHLITLRKSLQFVSPKTLDLHRLYFALFDNIHLEFSSSLRTKELLNQVESIDSVKTVESNSSWYKSYLPNYFNKSIEDTSIPDASEDNVEAIDVNALLKDIKLTLKSIKTPQEVSVKEKITKLDLWRMTKLSYETHLSVDQHPTNATTEIENKTYSQQLLTKSNKKIAFEVEVSSKLSNLNRNEVESLLKEQQQYQQSDATKFYLITNKENDKFYFKIMLTKDATDTDTLQALLASFIASKLIIEANTQNLNLDLNQIKRLSLSLSNNYINLLKTELSGAGWDISNHFLELERRRIVLS